MAVYWRADSRKHMGHGAYIAPDWTADYLHREAILLLNELAKKDNKVYHNLPDEEQARYKILLQKELRTNTFDEASNTIVISPERARVQRELAVYYEKLFMGDPSMNKLRDAYAIPVNTVKDIGRMEKMNAFLHGAHGCVLPVVLGIMLLIPTIGRMMSW